MTSQENARKLLQRLADDDDFRARMEADPVSVLAEHGFMVDREIAPAKVELPSKEDINKNIELLSKQFDATNSWVIFCR
ncbi:MAG: NHLP-related RiPP peptide [Pseudomonadota bacterium]|nr:NHLP-related RiPP peptide [Pseudomonadota bacterium]